MRAHPRGTRAAAHAVEGFSARMRAPFAVLGIRTAGGAVTSVEYLPRETRGLAPANALAERAVREIERYLADPGHRFTIAFAPAGTPFQRRVWDAIAAIPRGESRTYGELARQLHTAPRAIGGACGSNPIALVIPCHRVVGSKGALGGFMRADDGEALAIKRWLLSHEGYRFGR